MQTDDRKQRITNSFNAAWDYDHHGQVQRVAARHLAQCLPTASHEPSLLEIGCGTGFFSEEILTHFPTARLVCNDISPRMLERAEARLNGRSARFLLMDGENPNLDFKPDIIASSLAFQWFSDLPVALKKLTAHLAPRGSIAFSTLAQETFREWHQAHHELGLTAGTPRYPQATWFGTCFPPGWDVTVKTENLCMEYPSAQSFLNSVRGVGASVPAGGYRALTPAQMRRLLAHCNRRTTFAVTWEIAYVVATPLSSPA